MGMKKLAIFMAMMMLLPLAMATDFEYQINDAKGDVGIADIDIIQAWSSREGSNLVFHMKVAGKINNAYSYTFELNDGINDVGATYTNGVAYYVGTSSGGQPVYNINGNELTIDMPYSAISQLNADTTTFRVIAADVATQTADYAVYNSGNGGGGNENNNNTNDPTKENPTDESISVEITNVEYSIKKVDNRANWDVYVLIQGTTNGADHVSLNSVIYYKNGSHDVGSWIKGPLPYESNISIGGIYIKEFKFNSTQGNWNKWEFKVEGKYPVSSASYQWAEKENKVSKYSIYARAFKDAQETKWNQCHYDTSPSFTTEGAIYNYAGNNEKPKSKTPGFEFILVALAIGALLIIEKKKK